LDPGRQFLEGRALFLGVLVSVDPVVDPVMVTTSVLFENVALRSACAVGSVMGALLSILLFPCMSANALREMSAKFLASLISGVLFTPVVMRTSGLVMDLDHVVACSGAIAFFSVTVLHKSLPMLESTLGAWFQRQFERMFGK
jgi:uncharacterized protein YacL